MAEKQMAVRLVAIGGNKVKAELMDVGNAGRKAFGEIEKIAPAGNASGAALDRMGDSSKAAAMYAGQLGFQLNDIGTMLVSGQSPFLLMAQQGPQVVQIFGQMRAAGMAIGPAISGAFTSLLNPLSLATLAVIGFGAAAIQWLSGSEEEALTFEDAVKDLEGRIDAYKSAAERASGPTKDLAKDFGTASAAARAYYRDLAEVERREAERAIRTANEALQTDIGVYLDDSSYGTGNQNALADMFGLSIWSDDARKQINAVLDAMSAVGQAEGFEDQVDALERLKTAMEQAAAADGVFTSQEDAALSKINQLLLDQAGLREAIRKQREAEIANNGRFPSADQRTDYLAEQAAAQAELAVWARETLSDLQAELGVRQLIAQYGEDSVVVTAARANSEREAFLAVLESKGASEEMKVELMAAYDAANNITGVNLAAGIAAAIAPASELASKLWEAWRAAAAVAAATGMTTGSGSWYAGKTAQDLLPPERFPGLEAPKKPKGGGGGGGMSEAEKAEKDALREVEKLYKATRTEAEKFADEQAGINKLFADGHIDAELHARGLAMLEEKYHGATSAAKFFEDIQADLKESILDMAITGEASFDRIADAIKRAALQMLLFGEGPFASAFGGGFKGILGNFLSFDGGGWTGDGSRSGGVDGKGGFWALMHPREHVIDTTKAGGQMAAQRVEVGVTVGVDETGNLAVRQVAQRAAGEAVANYDRALPGRVAQIQKKPRMR